MQGAPPSTDGLPQQLVRTRRRVLTALAVLALGLTLGRALGWPSAVWFAAALGACALAIFAKGWPCRAALAAAILCGGAGWMQARVLERPPSDLATTLADTHTLVTVEGTVLRTPRELKARPNALPFLSEPRLRVDLDAHAVITDQGAIPATGKLWVRVRRADPSIARAGDRVRITGWYEPIGPPTNPGEDDLRDYAAQIGVSGSLTASGPELIQPAAPADGVIRATRGHWLRARAALEDRARDILTRAAGPADTPEGGRARALLLGLVLGDYDPSQRDVRDAFARQGLAHALSISGFHLSVMALLALFVLRLTGDRGWLEPSLVALIVILYALIVPASSPILRSALMVLGVMAAEASGRRYDRLTLLAWIAAALLIWRPLDLWNVGFQLSLGLTAALFWLGPVWHARLWGVPVQGIVRREIPFLKWITDHLAQALSTAVMCWGVSIPLVMLRFGLVSPLAVAATILVTPLIVAVLWAGYLVLLLGVFVPPAADAAAGLLGGLCAWSVASVRLFDALPWSALRVPVVSPLWCAAATLAAVLWFRAWTPRQWRAWAVTAIVGVWLVWQCLNANGLRRDVALRIDMLDVGNGSCYLVRSGSDALLWDCGPMQESGATPALMTAVRALGAWRTPAVVLTHPDLDHFAGLPEALEPLGVRTVLAPQRFIQQAADQPAGAAADLARTLRSRSVTLGGVQAGDTLTLGGATLRFIAPPPGAPWAIDNDHSLVALISTPAEPHAALLTGDIQDEAIKHLAPALAGVRPRVLELPHHGSARPAAIAMVQSLNPDVVLQSTGPQRAGDPRWDGVRTGRVWYATPTHGASWVELLHDGSIRSSGLR